MFCILYIIQVVSEYEYDYYGFKKQQHESNMKLTSIVPSATRFCVTCNVVLYTQNILHNYCEINEYCSFGN